MVDMNVRGTTPMSCAPYIRALIPLIAVLAAIAVFVYMGYSG
jgi:hypothetical protein